MANSKLDLLRQLRERAPSHATVAVSANHGNAGADPADGIAAGTYKYRDADSRRSYMANYMRGYRLRKRNG